MQTITDPIDLARQASAEYQACYGEALLSVILYGSAAGGDFDPRRSDINLLVVLDRLTPEALEQSHAVQARWLKRRFSRPLFMDPEYIDRSLDTFPIEFVNLRGCHEVMCGRDFLAPLRIGKDDLRLQAERELKGKWLHLMQGWLDAGKDPKSLARLFLVSLKDFAAVFRALLYLKDLPVPRQRESLFAAVAGAYELAGAPFERALDACRSGDKSRMRSVFPDYAQAVRNLSEAIDRLSTTEGV
jgi:hypothetical protein